MRNLTILTVLAVALAAGCSSNNCRQSTGGLGGWFNHGDRCNQYPADGCPPGGPRTQMMIPSTTPVLPGSIEIAPQ